MQFLLNEGHVGLSAGSPAGPMGILCPGCGKNHAQDLCPPEGKWRGMDWLVASCLSRAKHKVSLTVPMEERGKEPNGVYDRDSSG